MGNFYECLTGVIRCISAPKDNRYGFASGYDYDIIDGVIKEIESECCAVDLDELNWYFEKDNIKFILIERSD